MKNDALTLTDLASMAGVPEASLAEWTKARLLLPCGFTDDRSPLFPAAVLSRAAHVRKLVDLGYDTEEVRKIMKKFGLPRERVTRDREPRRGRFLTVGNLAERSGVSPRTIKHWEDKGIIEADMRTEGGFRLYPESFVFLCQLIRDLQLFGYTLEEIKAVSDDVRALLAIQADHEAFPKAEVEARLAAMIKAIQALFERMKLLEEGIGRWKDLLKKKKKDVLSLKAKNEKREKEKRDEGSTRGRDRQGKTGRD